MTSRKPLWLLATPVIFLILWSGGFSIAKFGVAAPRIAVCGLNPHAGEGGHLGREEIEIGRASCRERV